MHQPLPAIAQTRPGLVSFQRIAIPDDNPAHLATAMAQDRRGLLWIGTQAGLVRYDGYGYKVYRARPGDTAALGGSYVRALHVARDGRLWVGTISGGASVFDPRTEKFTQYRHGPDGGLAHDRVEGIAEDRDGMIWLATDDGLDRLDPATGAVTHFRHDPRDAFSLASNQVRSVMVDREGRLWVGGQDGLQLWRDGRWLRVASDPGEAGSLAGQHVTRLFQDARGRLWLATDKAGAAMLDPAGLPSLGDRMPPARGMLVRWTPADNRDALQLDPHQLSHYWVYAIAQAANGEIWLGTFGNGIDVIDPDTLMVVDRLRHDAGSASSIGDNRIGALLSDRSGLMWSGSWGGGIARHDPASRAFLKIRHSPSNPDTPSHPGIVRAMETADGLLWLGTNGTGVDVLDGAGHVRARYRPQRTNPGALADGAVTCLAQDASGGVWVATLDGTLHRLRPGAASFQRYGEAQGLAGGPIRTMVFGPDGALWAGSSKGLVRMALGGRDDGAVRVYRHAADDDTSLGGREVEALAFTPDGTLWVGTENGVSAFDTATGKAVRIRRGTEPDSLPDNWVPDMMVDRKGRLWLATQSGVAILSHWDGRQARFDVLARRIALPAQPAESLIEDAQGQVWLNGRIRIDPATWRVAAYGPADGADFRTRYIASRALTRRGDLLFGSPEGLLVVRPGLLRGGREAPQVVATGLSVAGREVPGGAELASLRLAPPRRSMRLEFAAPGYAAPDRVRYRYRLDGYDADWVEVDASQRVAAYTGLPPGEYRLRVQAALDGAADWRRDGQPNEWHMDVAVVPAFYQTVRFRALMWLLGGLAVFGLFRLRLRQLRRRAARLEQTVAERTAALESAYRDIEQASLTDPLTGLRNRRFLEQSFGADLELVARRHAEAAPPSGADLLLFMLDLDHFKSVNDQYGHAAGDAVLVQAAGVLRQCMRASDYIVRWGGEEFLLLARFVDRRQGAAMAEKLRTAIAAHPFALPDGAVLRKTVSIGYAACPPTPGRMAGVTLELLQRLADTALYAAKRSWRDAWVGVALPAGSASEEAMRDFLADPAAHAGLWQVEASRSDGLRWT